MKYIHYEVYDIQRVTACWPWSKHMHEYSVSVHSGIAAVHVMIVGSQHVAVADSHPIYALLHTTLSNRSNRLTGTMWTQRWPGS
jgi:hypothetical protein